MPGRRDEAIRIKAYEIWLREGQPHGRDQDHWWRAAAEVEAEALSATTSREDKVADAPEKDDKKKAKTASKVKEGAAAAKKDAKGDAKGDTKGDTKSADAAEEVVSTPEAVKPAAKRSEAKKSEAAKAKQSRTKTRDREPPTRKA